MADSPQMQMNVVVSLGEEQLNAKPETIEPCEMTILPLKQMVMFPMIVMPVLLTRKNAIKIVREAEKNKSLIAVVTQNSDVESPGQNDIYRIGCAARVLKFISNPIMGSVALLIGVARIEIGTVLEEEPCMRAWIRPIPETIPDSNDEEYSTLYEAFVDKAESYSKYSEHLPAEMIHSLSSSRVQRPILVNFLCSNVRSDVARKIEMLQESHFCNRIAMVMHIMDATIKQGELKEEILHRTEHILEKQQRKYFLHEQIKQIEKELGDGSANNAIIRLKEKAAEKKWSENIADLFENEIAKLSMNDSHSFEYNMQLNYLENLVSLPWGCLSDDSINLVKAQRILDHDHFGLSKVKERIIEHLAVMKLKGDNKSPILCLVGPPGVGKTSLGRSIASATNRQYVRVSLGGVHDESEIRGHRRTYVGAMPGRIIKALVKAGKDNPVFILDEIDKVGGYSNNGDPSSALLEVLDPEQNNAFHDNYLDVDYDLSKVMFIATANSVSNIPAPLLDRMEVINIEGYATEEKIEIAKRHLVRKARENNGIDTNLQINKAALNFLISNYTRESGVRNLEKQLNKLMRKIAVKQLENEQLLSPVLKIDDIEGLIGKPEYIRESYQGNEYAGVVTGLAWTQVGGEILFVETSISKGKGAKLTLTGNLGDVMKESATLALEYIKAHASTFDIDPRMFEDYCFHIHVPEGATPKDGPSAGITIVTSIVSAITQRKVRKALAMTGEITLRGKILPVGGIKEKILAAKRSGIKTIMLCNENKRNVEKIDDLYLKGLTFHFVDNIQEALSFALLPEKVSNPITYTFVEETPKECTTND